MRRGTEYQAMQIRRFYVEGELPGGGEEVFLSPQESLHALRVLRLRKGDALQLLNGRGVIADAILAGETGGRHGRLACCRVESIRRVPPPALWPMLCVAPPRGKAFDLVLKAAVELGVRAIQPILCAYGVARPGEIAGSWQDTLVTALKQSANPYLPQLLPPLEFAGALEHFCAQSDHPRILFGASPAAEATARKHFGSAEAKQCRYLFVGPEGGFAPAEESALLASGAIPVTLGSAVLRVETAVPALLGCLHGVASLVSE